MADRAICIHNELMCKVILGGYIRILPNTHMHMGKAIFLYNVNNIMKDIVPLDLIKILKESQF